MIRWKERGNPLLLFSREWPMTPNVKKAVIAAFQDQLKLHRTGFTRINAGLPHRTAFAKKHADNFTSYLFLHWHTYASKFSVDVGWTHSATLDELGGYLDAEAAMNSAAAIISLTMIAGRPESWYEITAYESVNGRAEPICKPVVQQAYRAVEAIGFPYLERVAKRKLAAKTL